MKFQDSEYLPGKYQMYYLECLSKNAPQVMRDLKRLVRKEYVETVGFFLSGIRANRSMVKWLFTESQSCDFGLVISELTGRDSYNNALVAGFDTRDITIHRRFLELRQEFQQLVARYLLTPTWLKDSMFFELSWRLGQPDYKDSNFLPAHSFLRREMDPFKFEYPGWGLGIDSSDYELGLREAFETQLGRHIQETTRQLKAEAYKEQTKSRDFDSVKWLVSWNMASFENLWEIIPELDEFSSVDVSNERQRKSAVDRIRHAFGNLEEFDLPVRDWKRRRSMRKKL